MKCPLTHSEISMKSQFSPLFYAVSLRDIRRRHAGAGLGPACTGNGGAMEAAEHLGSPEDTGVLGVSMWKIIIFNRSINVNDNLVGWFIIIIWLDGLFHGK